MTAAGVELVGGALVTAWAAAHATEGIEGEDTAEDRPAEGDIGDVYGGGGFADVPIQVEEAAVRGVKVVVTVEDRGKDL